MRKTQPHRIRLCFQASHQSNQVRNQRMDWTRSTRLQLSINCFFLATFLSFFFPWWLWYLASQRLLQQMVCRFWSSDNRAWLTRGSVSMRVTQLNCTLAVSSVFTCCFRHGLLQVRRSLSIHALITYLLWLVGSFGAQENRVCLVALFVPLKRGCNL